MRQLRHFAVLALGLALPAPLAAQAILSPYDYIETNHSVTLFGGYLETDPGRLDVGLRPGPLFGARYGLQLTGPLLGEVAVGVALSDRTIYAVTANVPNPPLAALGESDAVLAIAEAGLRFRITGQRNWRGLAPYLVLTAGLASDLASTTAVDAALAAEQRFDFGPALAVSAGLGTEYFVSERLSIRADFRDYFWRLNYPVGLTRTAERESQWRHNFALTIGSAIHF